MFLISMIKITSDVYLNNSVHNSLVLNVIS